MHLLRSSIVTTLLLMSSLGLHAQLVINELMQSNIDCLLDDLNEYPDSWVELHNNSNTSVNLSEYSIGLTKDASEAWKLPYRMISPYQFIVVYCDKVGDGMHANFRIDSGKGAFYLFHNNEIVGELSNLAKQPAPNISYGRKTEGSSEWGYQNSPTPTAPNCGTLCSEILGEPIFSEPGRVTTNRSAITLTLSLPEGCPEGTIIRYTTNGSEPTNTSTVYSNPITISSTRTIRAKLFCEGRLSSRSTTHSYIFFSRDVTLPVVSIVTDSRYFYDSKLGIYVQGSYKNGTPNYKFDWRRPINFEYFEGTDNGSILNQLCETRVQGGASRDCVLKSLIVYANKRFGEKRLKHEFFPDQRPGQTNYKSIILRNAGNDFDYLYMRDAIIQQTMAKYTDLDWQAWRPAIFYINGTYKGILNIRERSTADNIFTNYDELEDIDMIENWYQVKEGDMDNWHQFEQFYTEHGHTLKEYEEWIDWREFINLMVMNLYYNNQDFPGNNIVMWRPRAEGGLWRFVAKDTDFGLGLYGSSASYNSIAWLYNPDYDSDRNWANKYEHTRLFRRMMEDKDFEREFIDRAAIYMGDFLNSMGTREIWDPMYELIQYEYPYHRKLINQWWPNYSSELSTARNWLSQRTDYFYKHLADYYQVGTPTNMTVNTALSAEDLQGVSISFNDVQLSKGIFNGKFFAGREITLKGTPVDGKQVTGWKVTCVATGSTTYNDIEGDTYSFTMPSCNRLIVNAIIGEHTGISEMAHTASIRTLRNGDMLTISGTTAGTEILIYDLQGILVTKSRASEGETTVKLPRHGIFILKIGDKKLKIS